jgi:oxygen-dependent protoporphyrinogen oxidase
VTQRVLVAGGGIAGLSVAHAILRRGGDPLVLEASDRVGGYLQSFARDGIVFEHGPQGFLSERPGTLDLADELGLTDRVVRASETSKRRYVFHGGALRALPMSPPSILASSLLSWGAKLRVLGEPRAKPPPDREETIREFVTRRLGREVADVLADAAVTGIYAGDPARLSAQACFAKMTNAEKAHGSLLRAMRAGRGATPRGSLCSFENGMEELPGALAARLSGRIRLRSAVAHISMDRGVTIRTETGDRHEADALVLAIPAARTADLVGAFAPEIVEPLRAIESARVIVVGLSFAREQVAHPLDGYGFLVPGGASELLGCLFESTVFPGRAPEGRVLLRIMLGGARQPALPRRDEAGWIRAALELVRPILDISGEPTWSRAVVHDGAIPQYEVGHLARVDAIESALARHPRLSLAGASYRGVSVNQIAAGADAIAERALA